LIGGSDQDATGVYFPKLLAGMGIYLLLVA